MFDSRRALTIALTLFTLQGVPVLAQLSKPSSSHKSASTKSDSDFTSAMEKIRSTWVQEFNSGHADKVAALYATDAVIMRWDGSMHGRDSIQALLQKSVSGGAHDYTVNSLHTERSGNLGYDTGAYNVTLRDRVVEGNYLIVVKNIRGKWWIVAHASIPNPRER